MVSAEIIHGHDQKTPLQGLPCKRQILLQALKNKFSSKLGFGNVLPYEWRVGHARASPRARTRAAFSGSALGCITSIHCFHTFWHRL